MTLSVNGASNTNLTDFYDASVAVGAGAVPAGYTLIDTLNQVDPNPQQDTTDGFYGEAFANSSGQILIAFKGTYPNPADLFGLGTLKDDVQIKNNQRPPSFQDAVNFVINIINAAKAINTEMIGEGESPLYSLATLFLTGHSLGGAEAQYVASVAAATGVLSSSTYEGVTFAAPGLPQNPNANPIGSFLDYIDNGDPVGTYGSDTTAGQKGYAPTNMYHYGTVVQIGSTRVNYILANPTTLYGNLPNPNTSSGAFLSAIAKNTFVLAAMAVETGANHLLASYGQELGLAQPPAPQAMPNVQKANLASPISMTTGNTSSTPAASNIADPQVVLEGLDEFLGTAGEQDLAAATLSSDGTTLQSPDFTIAVNSSANTITITQNRAIIYNGITFAGNGEPISFTYDPTTLDITAASWSDPASTQTFVATINPAAQSVTQIIGNKASGTSTVENLSPLGQLGGSAIMETIATYASQNGTGSTTGVDIELASGGSEIVTYSSTGARIVTAYSGSLGSGSVVSTPTQYTTTGSTTTLASIASELGLNAGVLTAANPTLSGLASLPAGTTVLLYTDQENANGTSQITTTPAAGETFVQTYSGAHGSGQLVSSGYVFQVGPDTVTLSQINLAMSPDTYSGQTSRLESAIQATFQVLVTGTGQLQFETGSPTSGGSSTVPFGLSVTSSALQYSGYNLPYLPTGTPITFTVQRDSPNAYPSAPASGLYIEQLPIDFVVPGNTATPTTMLNISEEIYNTSAPQTYQLAGGTTSTTGTGTFNTVVFAVGNQTPGALWGISENAAGNVVVNGSGAGYSGTATLANIQEISIAGTSGALQYDLQTLSPANGAETDIQQGNNAAAATTMEQWAARTALALTGAAAGAGELVIPARSRFAPGGTHLSELPLAA